MATARAAPWLAAVAAAVASAAPAERPVVVDTESGQLEGLINTTLYQSTCSFFPPLHLLHPPGAPNVASFLGVPYVAPPTGENRFRPPQPLQPWAGVRKATKPGPVCAQLPVNTIVRLPDVFHPGAEEDCLTLNIWSPVQQDGSFDPAGRPILLFIHGGGYIGGNSYMECGCALYNAQQLAASTGAVVVTINYRLGIFGFLADPALRSESGTTGNYGLQDQRAAMAWVQRHAARFGGDPSRVTLAGQSAGATSVLHHTILPRSEGLFSQAIAMSGYGLTWTLKEAYSLSSDIADIVKCTDSATRAECLRKKSASELLKAEEKVVFNEPGDDVVTRMMAFGPVSDGYETPEGMSFDDVLKASKPKMPLIIGTTRNESNLLQCGLSRHMSHDEATGYMLKHIRRFIRGSNASLADVEHILESYPNFGTDQRGALMAFSTDLLFTCTAEDVAQRFTENGAPVHRYLLGRAPRPFQLDKCLGVPHVSGVFLLFEGAFPLQAQDIFVGGATEQAVARGIITGFGNFVREGAPGPSWPQWGEDQPMLQLGDAESGNFTVVKNYRREACRKLKALEFPNRLPHSIFV